jgi:hypothetical protein
MSLEQTRPAAADQQRFEDAVPADCGQVVGEQQRPRRVVQFTVQSHDDGGLARHGQEA